MDPESPWIERLLKTNHSPSEQEADEVRRLLLEPSSELEKLEGEIITLRNRLLELEDRRAEIQKQVARYKPILSPIRRVPHDIFGEIFYHCLPADRNPIMSSRDCPMLLTRVCSSWRTAAMTTPKLWDRIYITFTDDDTVPDLETLAEMARNGETIDGWRNAQAKEVKLRTTELLCRRYEAFKEWIARSGTRLLSISMYFTTTAWYAVPYSQRPPSVTMELLSLLASLAPRWKEFEVKASIRIYKVLENLLPISQMSAFTSLRAEYHPQYPEDEDATEPLGLMKAPNLQQVSMSVGQKRVWGIADNGFIPWHKLTHVTSLNTLNVADTTFLLERLSNLVHYKGIISEYSTETNPIAYEGYISLPFLKSLSITEYLNPQRVTKIYDNIDAPKLEWVSYFNRFGTEGYSVDNPAPMPILGLLAKSTELQYLSVDVSNFTVVDMGALLRVIPSVTDLAIGSEVRYMPVVTPSSADYDTTGFPNKSLWSLNDLIVGDSSDDLEQTAPLLPRLRSLAISSPSIQISDNDLFDLIKSRIIPSSAAATLKEVKVFFNRQMERDIGEELKCYAEYAGVKIDLSFEYAQPPPSTVTSTSPDFGLRGMDGRSWPYVDAGDYVLL